MRPAVVGGLAVVLALLLGSGCDHTKPAETQTPLGCDRVAGRYFDPVARKCVKASTTTQAYVLDKYRYTNQVATTTTSPIEWRINFSRRLSPTEYSSLMSELSPTSVTYLRLFFPTVDEGLTISRFLPDGTDFAAAPATVLSLSRSDSQRTKQPEPETLQGAFVDGQYSLWLVRVKAEPAAVLQWWNSHLDSILFAQPLLTDVDKIQPTFPPDSPSLP